MGFLFENLLDKQKLGPFLKSHLLKADVKSFTLDKTLTFSYFTGKEIQDVKNFFSNFENTFNNLKTSLSSIPSSIGQSLESLVGDIGGKLSKCRVPIPLFLLVQFPKVCIFSCNVRLCT